MKPHEQTWMVIPAQFGPWHVIHNGNAVATVGDGCANRDTADLIAAAPEMARLLLEAQWASGGGTGPSADDQHYRDHSCFFCDGFQHERSGGRGVYKWTEPAGHAADCCLVAVLRKVGVLP